MQNTSTSITQEKKKEAYRAAFFLGSLTALLIALFLYFDNALRRDTDSLAKMTLTKNAISPATNLDLFLRSQENSLLNFLSSEQIQSEIRQRRLSKGSDLQKYFSAFNIGHHFSNFILIDDKSRFLWSFNDNLLLYSAEKPDFYRESSWNQFISIAHFDSSHFRDTSQQTFSYFAVTPVFDDQGNEDAYIISFYNAEHPIRKVLKGPNFSSSTFLIDDYNRAYSVRNNQLVPELGVHKSPSCKKGLAAVNFPNVEIELQGNKGLSHSKVLQSWTHFDKWNFGILYEEPYEDIYSPLLFIRRTFWTLGCLMLLLNLSLVIYYINIVRMQHKIQSTEKQLRELGQYSLQKLIGEGGMGSVYKAQHKLLERPTAIKLLRSNYVSEQEINHFENEVRTVCHLSNPHTIAVYDYGRTAEGIFYYAMEYLEGFDLNKLQSRLGCLPPARLVHILLQVCSSLKEAHDAGLIHRDIKPANIMVTHRGGISDLVKVLDFGLVRQLDRNNEKETLSGTPHFLAPEAISCPSEVSPLLDIYSLGMTAYFLLIGKYPYEDFKNTTDLLDAHIHQNPRSIFEVDNVRVPEDLGNLIMSCLSRSKENRPQSIDAFSEALKKCRDFNKWSAEDADIWWARYGILLNSQESSIPQKKASELEMTVQFN